eukprot:Gb_32093 [translate_table: standard]
MSMALLWLYRAAAISCVLLLFTQPALCGDIVHDDDIAPKQPGCKNKFVLLLPFPTAGHKLNPVESQGGAMEGLPDFSQRQLPRKFRSIKSFVVPCNDEFAKHKRDAGKGNDYLHLIILFSERPALEERSQTYHGEIRVQGINNIATHAGAGLCLEYSTDSITSNGLI